MVYAQLDGNLIRRHSARYRAFQTFFASEDTMRNDWLSLLKAGFKSRIIIACAVVFSATFFRVIAEPILRLTLMLVFLLTAELFVLLTVRRFISNSLSLFINRKTQWVSIPKNYAELATRMEVSIRKFGIREDIDNAYTNLLGKTVVMGKKLNEKLNDEQRLAVMAHEFAHIKKKQALKSLLLLLPFGLCALPLGDLPPAMCVISILAYMFVVMTPINWRNEFEADKTAADFVGVEKLRSALLVIAGKNIREPSETHPSIAKRLEKLG